MFLLRLSGLIDFLFGLSVWTVLFTGILLVTSSLDSRPIRYGVGHGIYSEDPLKWLTNEQGHSK